MGDKQSQQRRRRHDGAVRSVADRSAVEKIAPLLPKPPKQRKGGRPWIQNRRVLEGILWILRSGARWQDLPEKFPHPSTCWRRLRDWEERGVWLNIWRTFLSELNERQQLKWSESFLDGSFAPAKKGAQESEKPSGARGRSGWWWSTAAVFLWETTFTLHPRRKSSSRNHTRGDPGRTESPCRPTAAETGARDCRQSLRQRSVAEALAATRDRTDLSGQRGIEFGRQPRMAEPCGANRRRWIVERTNAWLGNFRRLVVRYDRSLTIYGAFFHIACFMIVLRRVVQ